MTKAELAARKHANYMKRRDKYLSRLREERDLKAAAEESARHRELTKLILSWRAAA